VKKILVITDSLGLPRRVPELVDFEETWVNSLAKVYSIHQLSIGGATINDLYEQTDYAKMFNPDFVIIQSGIVDCAPRALTKFENQFLNKFSFSRFILKRFLTKKRLETLRKKRNCTYTSINEFDKYVELFVKEFGNKLFWIGIVPASNSYESLVPGISNNITRYNEILRNKIKSNYITLEDYSSNHIMTDNIHLSSLGHHELFQKIVNIIPNV
jgi:hypothetical protein